MEDSQFSYVDTHRLRIGLFIQLELGWMDHPFPVGSFKIVSEEQLQTLRSLGVPRVRVYPGRSDPAPEEATDESAAIAPPGRSQATDAVTAEQAQVHQRRRILKAQQQSLALCERRFGEAAQQFDVISGQAMAFPESARQMGEHLVHGCLSELLSNGESVIRLLSEGTGERSTTHAVNVMVISLLLGRALNLGNDDLAAVGIAALLHDLGKLAIPDRSRHSDDHLTPAETRQYQGHVAQGVALAQRMRLPAQVIEGIAHHHEYVDGSGFPQRITGERMGQVSRILSLVNHYDNLCNPARSTVALTPHEALSVIFAQYKARFEPLALGAFIRLMGVYPPGSIVQLINDRFALVVSVNAARPLRPRVIVHDPRIPRDEALILDLEDAPELGIRRSLKPMQLPKAAMEYLSPRQRICYFFERAVEPVGNGVVG